MNMLIRYFFAATIFSMMISCGSPSEKTNSILSSDSSSQGFKTLITCKHKGNTFKIEGMITGEEKHFYLKKEGLIDSIYPIYWYLSDSELQSGFHEERVFVFKSISPNQSATPSSIIEFHLFFDRKALSIIQNQDNRRETYITDCQ